MDFDNELLNEEMSVLDVMEELTTSEDGIVFSLTEWAFKDIDNECYINKDNGIWTVDIIDLPPKRLKFTNIYNLSRWYINEYSRIGEIDVDKLPMILARGTRVVINNIDINNKDNYHNDILYGTIIGHKAVNGESIYQYQVLGDDNKEYNCIWLRKNVSNIHADLYMNSLNQNTYIRTLEDSIYNLREEITSYEATKMDDEPIGVYLINELYHTLEELVEYTNEYIESKSSKSK